ncbi:NTP transferase domain-containing protein [Muricauda sp. 2012CJ35-5]|uniref:NTP transferase domain-containing protein n=1 Tax=Flagellimonas spongiicola TaxID=2942208 RepID=A0ABT0PSA9_9FLAO|nr:NTP transferase domain-containing protein [Allomuricauda spongiicola]MCL6274283.1 NTP transferase domain-containing protein [Allomuricauda spongiicola]
MKIIIPMSGMGNRFVKAGYSTPKPLIEIDGKPIIEHVVGMFPGEHNFIFICNSQHLRETNMRDILKGISPDSIVTEIPPHKKGPVYAVHLMNEYILDDEEVIVNYCDFSCYWDYHDFLDHTRTRNADGAVPAYKGFHPHMLGTTNYAFMRDDKQWMLEIKEKEPFTDNRMEEFASIGTYYFKKGSYVKKYFKELMDKDINLNGEYYVSLIYNLLVNDGFNVSIYDVQHMLQWGTPQDVEEYNGFSNYFKAILEFKVDKQPHEQSGVNLIPLAGKGSRFTMEGYKDPKPLISVSGKPMIIQASEYLPSSNSNIFVCLEDHLKSYPLEKSIKQVYPKAKILPISGTTEGQACTCELGLANEDNQQPLLIAACDNGMIYNKERYSELLDDKQIDAIIWSFKNHPSSEQNPEMYGWLKVDGLENVTGVSVKKQISGSPRNDHAIVGTFYFRKAKYFLDALKRMYEKDIRVNGEFYVDSCVNELVDMGLNVKVFQIDHYLGWGTPNDYRTFKYWQSFFHKVDWHPYRLEKDPTMKISSILNLKEEYQEFNQEWR